MTKETLIEVMANEHTMGPRCNECWPNYPKPCTDPDCDGWVHAEFGDENDEDYWLVTCCELCGKSEVEQ